MSYDKDFAEIVLGLAQAAHEASTDAEGDVYLRRIRLLLERAGK